VNIKKAGNENERRIAKIINEILGVEYKRTELSGGGDKKGDLYDYGKGSPLSKYNIEVKYHGNWRSFNKCFKNDIYQAISQSGNKNWLLIEHIPDSSFDVVVLDLKDYLINDILGQMVVNKAEGKEILYKFEKIKKEVDDLVAEVKKYLK